MTDVRLRLDAADARPDPVGPLGPSVLEPRAPLDFERLVELGRSQIPNSAAGWTDHNVHDPGIMLLELLAWVAEAQVYSLSRTRRDERLAYASLLGVKPRGPRPANGMVWPVDGTGTPAAWHDGHVVETHDAITPAHPNMPVFFATHPIQLTAATLERLYTRFADGTEHDWLGASQEDGATFLPFGEMPAQGDALVLDLKGKGIPVPIRSNDSDASPNAPGEDALLSIGFEVVRADDATDMLASDDAERIPHRRRLFVTVVDALGERPASIAVDTTDGLLHSGVVLLRGVLSEAEAFSLEVRSARQNGAFLRPPRVRRIGVNVIPVQQRQWIPEHPRFVEDLPDQTYQLQHPSPEFPPNDPRAGLTVTELAPTDPVDSEWKLTGALSGCGPSDPAFELDRPTRTLRFGNGVNGRIPPAGQSLDVRYAANDGTRGNLPAGIAWTIRRVAGVFGRNSEPTTGGRSATDLNEIRGLARQATRAAHPLVTTEDLIQAARRLPDLGVKRAIEVSSSELPQRRARGARVLVALGPHDSTPAFLETTDWLGEVRGRLAPRLPLGHRLEVIAPHYVGVRVVAELMAARNLDPREVATAAQAMLRSRLALVTAPDASGWPFGRDVTVPALRGWLRRVEGVAKVVQVHLYRDGDDTLGKPVLLGPIGLPLLQLDAGDIVVTRWTRGTPP